MPTINLLNEMAVSKSIDQNSANLINLYLQIDQDQGKYQVVAYPTPGGTLFSSGTTSMRALYTVHGVTYGVDGNTLFSVNSSGTRTTLGTLNTSSGWCKIRANVGQVFIADGTNGYYYIPSGNTFGVISNTGQGVIEAVIMITLGSGYTSPTCTFSDSTGTGATGTVNVSDGQVVGVTITNEGNNYTSPTISFSDSTGTGASASVQVESNNFPTSVQDIECQDEFGLVLLPNSQTWQASAISDITEWPALSFASTTGNQNYNAGIVSLHREIWLLGTQTSEVWDNLGTVNFTFGRNQSVYIEYGCGATASIAKGNNTIYYLAQSPSGSRIVVNMNAYSPVKISNASVDYQLSIASIVSDAVGFIYQQEGHEFYVLTLPTAGLTFVYDEVNQQWHQRQSLVNGSQVQWLANCYTNNYNKCLVGDSNSGNIYSLDMTNFTENGTAISRTLITHPFYAAGMWNFLNKIQIDFDNSPGASLADWTLYVSRDGGRTFGAGKPAIVQTDANGYQSVYWNRLGIAKCFVFKLTTNANILPIILGAWATYSNPAASNAGGNV